MTRQERFDAVIDYFKITRPEAETELVFGNAYELLVAVILSAQCTDKRINLVTPALFERYATPEDLAAATVRSYSCRDIVPAWKSCSYRFKSLSSRERIASACMSLAEEPARS